MPPPKPAAVKTHVTRLVPAVAPPRHPAQVAALAAARKLKREHAPTDNFVTRLIVFERTAFAHPPLEPAAARFEALRRRVAMREAVHE